MLTTACVAVALLPACSHSKETSTALPAAPGLLREASRVMAGVQTVRFTLHVQGEIGGVPVRSAVGVLTSDGSASGTAELEEGGSLVEFDVVIVKGTIYLKGPTGGFQEIPSFLAGSIYDPTELLDPQAGLSRLLATASRARTVGSETVGDTPAYRVNATLDGKVLSTLVPTPSEEDAPSVLWIAADTSQLVKVQATLAQSTDGETAPSVVLLELTDFDVPVTITPPG